MKKLTRERVVPTISATPCDPNVPRLVHLERHDRGVDGSFELGAS
jgi:hypothetical protein